MDCIKPYLNYFNINNKINNSYIFHKNSNIDNNDTIIINGNIFTECCICFNIIALKDIKLIYPCGHRLYCDNCLKNLNKCPSCSNTIENKIKVFENLNNNYDNNIEDINKYDNNKDNNLTNIHNK